MDLNNVANFINEGIKAGICNGQVLAFSTLTVMAVIKNKKRVPMPPKGACKPLKNCKSRHFCLKNGGTCPEEI